HRAVSKAAKPIRHPLPRRHRLAALRSFSRRTNFRPDHTSVTAQTFTSTSPADNPIPRILFSSKSVATPELFFGQLAHSIPAGASFSDSREKSFSSGALALLKIIAKSSTSPRFAE